MSSVIDALRSLAPVVAGSLPCGSDLDGLSAAEEVEAARLLGGIRSQLDESIAVLAADIERRSARELGADGLAARNGFTDGAGLVQDLIGVRRDEAARLIRVGGLIETAEAVAPLPVAEPGESEPAPPARSIELLRALDGSWAAPVAVALRYGWLSAAQADALRTGLGTPRAPEFAEAWRSAVLELIGDCWVGHWNPEDVGRAAKRMRGSLDSALAATEAQKRYELRSFRRVVRASGMAHYDIDLDPESDARFYGPIKRLLSPRFGGPRFTKSDDIARAEELEHDARTNEQLQVDTLVDLVDRAVGHDNGDLFRSHEPQVMVAVTTGDLEKARGTEAAVRRHLTGDHTACPGAAHTGAAFRINRADCPGPDRGIAWIDGRDEPITAADALRMLCDRGYTPALFDETGHAIDIGKDKRYFTRNQRRAIAKRDGRCLYPGCDRPPEDCEYHHVNPWAAHPSHRKSEVRDGVLLCRRHHKLLHDFAARIERRGSEYWLHWPGKVAARLHSKSGVQVQLHLSRRQT